MLPKVNITHRNREHLDSMRIGQGHTILASYVPEAVGAQTFCERYYEWVRPTPESITQFGLFGSDIDYNTYYPELKAEDLKPKDEEFIEPVFRLLSETIVSKNWNPTDFSKNGVLKASMKLLLGQTVNCDHSTDIGNAIGSVSKVMWQDGYKDGSFSIPAGINGVLKIDGKANPRIARGILMEPPSIHSNSVTVQFKWDKSHPGMEDNEFYQKLGTYDSKGQMVRRVVTEVVRYFETSLVSHGADSFAQKIGSDGKIVNPTFAQRSWASYKEYEEDTKQVYYFSDFKDYNDTQESFSDTSQLDNQDKNSMNELELFIENLVKEGIISFAEGTEANQENALVLLKGLVSSKGDLQTQVDNLTTEKNQLTDQIANKDAEIANLKDMATVGKNYIASLREDTVATYKKLMGDQVDETIVTMLNSETTGLATLISLKKDYEARLDEKFPMQCAKCGSHEISRASSVKEDTTVNKEDKTVEGEIPSNESLMEQFYRNKLK